MDAFSSTFRVNILLECPNCDERFRSQNDLEAHVVRRCCDITVICDNCDQQFSGYLDLAEHQRVPCQLIDPEYQRDESSQTDASHGKQRITCIRCKLQFPSVTELKRHTACFHPKPADPSVYHNPSSSLILLNNDLFCVSCDKIFKRIGLLRQHITQNSCADPVQCPKCEKHYRGLATHERKCHSATCVHCGKICKYLSDLQQHMCVHTLRDQQYLCDRCGQVYGHLTILRKHMRTEHNINWTNINDVVRCSLCDSVTTKRLLFHHVLSCHRQLCCCNMTVGPYDPVRCHNCQMTVPAAIDYASHTHLCLPYLIRQVLPERCSKCAFGTKSSRHLLLHQISHMTVDDFASLEDESGNMIDERSHWLSTQPTKKHKQIGANRVIATPGLQPDPSGNGTSYHESSTFSYEYSTNGNEDMSCDVSRMHGLNILQPQLLIVADAGSTEGPHRPTITEDNAYSCFVCLKQFNSESYAKIHVKLCESRHNPQ